MVLPANHYPMPTVENRTEGIARASCFYYPCCCWQVWARVSVWKGVDGVPCGVQAHKCPKGGLEPESLESPILGTWPANHYAMPAFENFTEGIARASCFSCPCCCCWQVWARVCVWKGVDGVLCGVQAHKCPKGGLEPESVESPILGMWPPNH